MLILETLQDLRLRLEAGLFRIVHHPVSAPGNGGLDRRLDVEVGAAGRVAHIDEDRAFVAADGVQEHGVAHPRRHVEGALGNGDVRRRAIGQQTEQAQQSGERTGVERMDV